jgi:predicted dienelactone hydrolase
MNAIMSSKGKTFQSPLTSDLYSDLSLDGPFRVAVEDDIVVKDKARDKHIRLKIYFPETGTKFPVILFSHGFGGNKNVFEPVGKHWASHGFVVIHPTHFDGMAPSSKSLENAPTTALLSQTRLGNVRSRISEPKNISDRVQDLVVILDDMDNLSKLVPRLIDKLDQSKIGVGGHSFGAFTAMLIGGTTVNLGKDFASSYADKRIKCILPISAQGTGQQGLTRDSWKNVRIPMMVITGTNDRGVGNQGYEWKMEPYEYSGPGGKFLVVIDGANHFSFGGQLGPRGKKVVDCVKCVSTHFWNTYLKESGASGKVIMSDTLPKDIRSIHSYRHK